MNYYKFILYFMRFIQIIFVGIPTLYSVGMLAGFIEYRVDLMIGFPIFALFGGLIGEVLIRFGKTFENKYSSTKGVD